MMFVDLNELREREKPLRIVKEFGDKELKVDNPIGSLRGPVHSEMEVSLWGERVHVEGELGADLVLTCSRCLKFFDRKIQKEFEVEFVPDPVMETEGEEVALTYTDLDVGFYRDDGLDVGAVISEQIVLEIPMQPICQKACKGLCHQCGADLNEGDCNCQDQTIDPRFEALLDLKKRLG
ncbi:MAG: DUF177 domain-containing protein [Acidobacteria bacterium]|nr:DUF177 domain-containing protein [Acidobacteriota bacterium]MCZ6876710.1 DUF177 domain-containing protein [Acidobacteriota bacterium]